MKPTDILSSEHRVIEQVLDCLDKMIQTCQTEHKFDKQSAKDAVDFFRNFADRCHHGKEEAHLFPAMEAKGFARDCGPTGVMIYEHEQGRKFVRGMAESIDAAAKGDACRTKGIYSQRPGIYRSITRTHPKRRPLPVRNGQQCFY